MIVTDDHGQPVHCSFCAHGAKRVVVLLLTNRPELKDRILASDGEELWMGLCAYCVLTVAAAEGT